MNIVGESCDVDNDKNRLEEPAKNGHPERVQSVWQSGSAEKPDLLLSGEQEHGRDDLT